MISLDKELSQQCPCGTKLTYSSCCYLYITLANIPEFPEQLMRSRYTAFVFANGEYLYNTHHPETRSSLSAEELRLSAQQNKWCKLEVLSSIIDNPVSGKVSFKAFYIRDGFLHCHHEISTFKKQSGRWLYHSPEFPEPATSPKKINRNESCPCGSNKKFKRCCG